MFNLRKYRFTGHNNLVASFNVMCYENTLKMKDITSEGVLVQNVVNQQSCKLFPTQRYS